MIGSLRTYVSAGLHGGGTGHLWMREHYAAADQNNKYNLDMNENGARIVNDRDKLGLLGAYESADVRQVESGERSCISSSILRRL